MKREIIATGATEQEAYANAAMLLEATENDNIVYEVIARPRKGFLGIGAQPAQVRAILEVPDTEPKEVRHGNRQKNAAPARTAAPSAPTTQEAPAPAPRPARQQATPQKPAPEHEPMKTEAEVVLTPITAQEGEDLSFDLITRLIADLGIDATASLYMQDEGGRRICIAGSDASMLIGHHGETLDALQYLSNLACAKKNVHGERLRDHVTIDIEGYRAKREQTLRALARRTAARVLKNRRNVTLEPMNAYERRIIHSEVQGIAGVSTNSIGSDNNRRVVVYLADKPASPASETEETHDAV